MPDQPPGPRPDQTVPQECDLFVIGGGVNGCGIARDAAGRGLRVVLAEKDDLGAHTSSASTKLFHGGLRYLEYFEWGLVRSALQEREVLLRMMPHISWPLRFVLPVRSEMRFDGDTPTSRLLARVMPWSRGRRPGWLIRLGLFLYDTLGRRQILPGTRRVDLAGPEGQALAPGVSVAWEYSDCWVDDARLVALNARDAAARGATILTRAPVASATREGHGADAQWQITLADGRRFAARALVNATGPWAGEVETRTGAPRQPLRLVRGSHVITRRLYEHDKCYFLQGADRRIVFLIPYEDDFTLIGTTDADHDDPDTPAICTKAERDYLLRIASDQLGQTLTPADVVHSYAGVRPLLDSGGATAAAATRDYDLRLEQDAGAPRLSVFGGKITTYRKLSEQAVDQLAPLLGQPAPGWTAGAPLPGGDFAQTDRPALHDRIAAAAPFLTPAEVARLLRSYGTEALALLAGATTRADMGRAFGAGLTAREADWLVAHEFATEAEDILWRRTKRGLHMSMAERTEFAEWFSAERKIL
ncbi:glycerol-3-phosphate dehydrogenase [Pseudooceanicola aestuarii]|uniref:glycerol-3-phosphate dehydrogenase n=1 Tax=Pseudooceanicola aestuarii TaxID=2697319 RepID=UPI0013D6D135|nr:glycerol-3-phosphate dehydrogenase [Pseudooceanicola aestuarii]